jgi:hypothetical protein
MRILQYMWLGAVLAACSSDQPNPNDLLSINAQTTEIAVGGSTVMKAQLVDTSTNETTTVTASWTVGSDGIIMLTQQGELEQVTGLAAGSVVVTANDDGLMQQIGFTVTP